MIGPVYNAALTRPSVGPALIAEVIGLFFVYAAVFGNIRQIPAKPSRIVNLLVFGASVWQLSWAHSSKFGRRAAVP